MKKMFYPLIITALLIDHVTAWAGTSPEASQAVAQGDKASSANQSSWMLAGILPQDGEALYEIEFWNSIKDSKNAEDYEAYLKTYPNGRFAPLAKVRAQRYREQPVQIDEPTPTNEPAETETLSGIAVEEFNERMQAVTNTNIRKEPSSNANRVGLLIQGQTTEVTGRVLGRDWYRINNPAGGEGFVYAPLLERPKPPTQPDTTTETATPTPAAPSSEAKVETPKVEPAAVKPKRSMASGESFKDCPSCPEMLAISPGQFVMGDNKGDRSERPAHRVRISEPFAIGKYEVTVGQWSECVKAGACKSVSANIKTSDNAPIRDVSWDDAHDYVSWLSRITGAPYRLPTEAEWEYANRAGSTTTYWWGDKMVPGKANCKDCGGLWDQKLPAEIGSYEANPNGLHDMNGNVWEWVSDCWHRNYQGAPSDGKSWDDANCTVKVIRGGSWRNDKTYVHSASRFKYDTYVRYLLNGFRVARSMD
jgi:formylglycine-generating enzyme required for sulfatase activity